jgi:hypothetical protein
MLAIFMRLFGVAEESRLFTDAGGPLRLDLDGAGLTGGVVVEAAPSVVFGADD